MAEQQDLEPPAASLTSIQYEPPVLSATGGTYALALRLVAPQRISVGALGAHAFPAGMYLYVGSAWGPGGLRARVGRHLRCGTRLRWHIDYLRATAAPMALFLAPDAHLECVWADDLIQHPSAGIVVPRFGASDCSCRAHLFHLEAVALTRLNLSGAPQFVDMRAWSPRGAHV